MVTSQLLIHTSPITDLGDLVADLLGDGPALHGGGVLVLGVAEGCHGQGRDGVVGGQQGAGQAEQAGQQGW